MGLVSFAVAITAACFPLVRERAAMKGRPYTERGAQSIRPPRAKGLKAAYPGGATLDPRPAIRKIPPRRHGEAAMRRGSLVLAVVWAVTGAAARADTPP